MFRIINKALWTAVVVAATLLPLAARAQLNQLGSFGVGLPWPPAVGQCLIGVSGTNGIVAQWGSCSGSGTTVSSVTGDGQVVASPTIGSVILSLGNTITNNEVFSSSLNVTGTFEIGGTPILAEATNSALGAVECDGTTINCSSGVISALGAPATSVTVGTTTVGSGTNGYLLYDNGGTLGNLATTGSGSAVLATSPTLVTPALGAATATTLAVGGASLGGNAVAVTGSGSFSGNLTATNITLAGFATGLTAPVNPSDAANKAYVDAIANGQTVIHTPVTASTSAAAPTPNSPTYNNGSSGVGATLTDGTAGSVLVIDGITISTLGTRVGITDLAADNGIYTLTTAGAAGVTKWVLTRATDFDQAVTGEIALGAQFNTVFGSVNINHNYWMNQTAAITVGTTAITFALNPGCSIFTSAISGCVPASGGGTTNFLRADGTWASPPGGGGAVTSVGLTVPATSILGVTGSPVTTSGNLGLTTTGIPGGVPYFSSGSALSSSGTLTNHALVLGGGSGATPTSLASLGTTTTLLHGNAAGAPTYSPVALGTDVSGNLPLPNMAIIGTLTALGNATGGSATPTALSKTQLTTLINTFTPSLPGLVPASGGGTLNYLRADGSFVPGTAAPTLQPCTVQTASYGLNYAGSTACTTGSDVNSLIPFLPSTASVVITVPQSTGTVFPPNTGATIYNQSNSPYPISVCLGTSAAWSASSTANIAANSLCPASGNGITLQRGETLQLVTDSANAWRALDTPTPYPSSVLLPQNTLSGDPAGFSTGWTATRATLTSAAGGPVGNAPVGTVAEDTSTNTHIISQTISYAGPIQINVQTKAGTLTRNPYIVVTDAGGDQLSVVWTQSTCQPLLVQNNAGLIGQAAVLSQSGYHVFANGSDTGWCQLSATINMPGVTLNQFRLGLYNGGTFYTGSTGTLLFANAAVTPAPNAIPGPGRPIIIACTVTGQTATFNSTANIVLATTAIPVGCPVYIPSGPPTGLTANTTYYVVSQSGTTVTISATPGGTAITIGSSGTATMNDAAYLATGSATTIMAMNLPSAIASDWDCTGNFLETVSTTNTVDSGSIGLSNNTLSTDASRFDLNATLASGQPESFVLGTSNFQVNAATPVYAVLKSTFGGTNIVQGNFRCRMFH